MITAPRLFAVEMFLMIQATELSPSCIYLDEADALIANRTHSPNVLTLLSLIDGLPSQSHVVVLASTNDRENVEPALCRQGRLDIEYEVTAPKLQVNIQLIEISQLT